MKEFETAVNAVCRAIEYLNSEQMERWLDKIQRFVEWTAKPVRKE